MVEIIKISIVVFVYALYDWYVLNRLKKYIYSHNVRWIVRVISILIISTPHIIGDYICIDLIELLGYTLFFMSTFDNTLNLLRFGKKGLFHLGTTATWDKFWTKHYTLYKILMPICLALSIYLLLTTT